MIIIKIINVAAKDWNENLISIRVKYVHSTGNFITLVKYS